MCNGVGQQPLHEGVVILNESSEDRGFIGRQQVDTLIENRQIIEFAVGNTGSTGGNRCIKNSRVSEGRIQRAGGGNGRHGGQPSAR